ncbi:hypothetical protein A2U01_0101269, partial [Trifolium medium]|nr:hypothetical protein [Trifolium medium]
DWIARIWIGWFGIGVVVVEVGEVDREGNGEGGGLVRREVR